MQDDPRWDGEMRAVRAAMEALEGAPAPPIIAEPMQQRRALDDALAIAAVGPGPAVAEVLACSVAARGRLVPCRLYRPSDAATLPVVVYLHGGGWVWSSIDTHDRLARELALASGAAVLSVDYALAPESRFPTALLECAAVVAHLAEAGLAWRLDPARIALAGDSAGGNLALAAALLLRDTAGPLPRGVLAFYPVCDADFSRSSYRAFAEGYGLTESTMRALWDAYVSHPADRWNPLAAPLRGQLAGLPPVLLQLAELDVLRSEGEAMAAALARADVAVHCDIVPGMAHGFVRHTGRVARARAALADAGAWLARILAA